MTPLLETDAGAAVAAGVVERGDHAVLAPHDDHRLAPYVHTNPVPSAWNFAGQRREQPLPLEEQLHLQIEDVPIDVEGLVETPIGRAPGQQRVRALDRLLIHR